jgi:phosphate transport system substrate-binding protein
MKRSGLIIPAAPMVIGIVLGCFVSSCKPGTDSNPKNELVIEGSESERLLVDSFASRYMAQTKDVAVSVKGGGSEFGISELKGGKCDIANSSRVFTEEDYARFPADSVKQAIVAADAIAIITNPFSGMRPLSLLQLADIYTGRLKNWNEIGGPDAAIIPVGRKEGSGTRQYMQNRLNIDAFAGNVVEFGTYEEIVSYIKSNKAAIGFVSLRYAMKSEGKSQDNIQLVPVYVDNLTPKLPFEKESIASGDYPLTRPLFQYYIPGKNPETKKIIDFELSDAGQKLVKEVGYFPINDFHKQINKIKM